jgi:8-oxo-dGTP pyrophosphatase MutT (NUDIX family)
VTRQSADVPIKRLKQNIVYENRWLRLYDDEIEHPNGAKGTYSWVERNNGRGGAIVIPRLPDGRILLVRMHRYVPDRWSWEFPGGAIDSGETAERAALRELNEEVGISGERASLLGQFSADSGFIKIRHSAVLIDISEGGDKKLKLDDGESITDARWVTDDEAWRMVASGEIWDGVSITCLGLLKAVAPPLSASAHPSPAVQPRRVRARLMYDSPWWRLFEDDIVRHDGRQSIYVRVETATASGAIMVIPRTPSGRYLLIKTYRYPVDRDLWEFPAGLVEVGEDPVDTATRELEEETGLKATSARLFGTQFPVAGLMSDTFYTVLAEVPEASEPELTLQAEEGITGARFVTLDELAAMVRANEIQDGVTLGAVARLLAAGRQA